MYSLVCNDASIRHAVGMDKFRSSIRSGIGTGNSVVTSSTGDCGTKIEPADTPIVRRETDPGGAGNATQIQDRTYIEGVG